MFPWSNRKPDPKSPIPVHIVGNRVQLREKSVSDIPDDYEWRSDSELAELDATTPVRMSYREFEKYSKAEITYPLERSRRLAVDTADGLHIGNVMFYDIDLPKAQAELGIMIGDKRYWSQGYGAETLGLLLDYMFTDYPFDRVYLHTLTWNHRAQKSFHKAGFKDIGPVRKNGRDFIKMEIWRHEWDALRATRPIPNEPEQAPTQTLKTPSP